MQATIAPETIALIKEWTEVREGGITPVHEVRDTVKYESLVASMEEGGWEGAPLVVDGDQALTGSHRYWAALATYTEIPRIQIEDVCDLFDVDWTAHREELPSEYDAYLNIADKLPADVVAYLGLDIH